MRNETRIILASASPRRRELLSQIGLDFEVMVSQVEEKASSMLPELVVEELSAQKAEAVLAALPDSRENVLVIGADTVVALEGQILGKPRSTQEAARMLRSLSGKAHGVYTGVTLLYRPGGRPSREGTGTGRGEPCPSGKPCLTVRKTFHERTDDAEPFGEGPWGVYGGDIAVPAGGRAHPGGSVRVAGWTVPVREAPGRDGLHPAKDVSREDGCGLLPPDRGGDSLLCILGRLHGQGGGLWHPGNLCPVRERHPG